MKKKLIALIFSVAGVAQFAGAVDKNMAPVTSVTQEEVAALAVTVQAKIQEGKAAGKTNEQIVTEIAHTVLGGSNLAGEQKKKYTKAVKIICGILGVVVVEEVLLPKAAEKWWKERHWLLQFGYGRKACSYLRAKMFSSEEANEEDQGSEFQLMAEDAARDGADVNDNDSTQDGSEDAEKEDPVDKRISDLAGVLTFVENSEGLSEEFDAIKGEDSTAYESLDKDAAGYDQQLQTLNDATLSKLDAFANKLRAALAQQYRGAAASGSDGQE